VRSKSFANYGRPATTAASPATPFS
jgi:hypothetical protein